MLKTALASKIPGLYDKYSDNAAYKVRSQTPSEMFQSMILDIHAYADEQRWNIKSITSFSTSNGMEIVVAYDDSHLTTNLAEEMLKAIKDSTIING